MPEGAKKWFGGAFSSIAALVLALWVVPAALAAPILMPEEAVFKGAYASFPDYMDPQLSYTAEGWTAMYDTYIPLLTYRHAAGRAGNEVIPGLARSLPRISDGGRTYTLFLRRGLRYSDGEPVRASDFRFTVERMFKINSGGSQFYTDIAGVRGFRRHRRAHIGGIVTDDRSGRIVIHLKRPRSTFSNELALLFVAPVPARTPVHDQSFDPPPATGPYVITSSRLSGWTYARNPQWANNARLLPRIPGGQIGRIDIEVIHNVQTQVNLIESGRLDWMFDPPPIGRTAEVEARYAGTQFRFEPTLSTYYFWMNTHTAPFDNLDVRRAVNYAVDPTVLHRIYAGQMTPTDQILPPTMPGYRKLDLYPHSMATARRLIAAADPKDREITVWTDSEYPNSIAGEYYAGVLKRLGFHVTLAILNPYSYFSAISDPRTPSLDTGFGDWFEDYPHPNDFFGPLLATPPQPTYTENFSQLVVPSLNRRVAALDKTAGPIPTRQYAALDRDYMKLAPMVPWGTRALGLFVSSAIDLDKVIWNPTFEADLSSFQFSSTPDVKAENRRSR